MDFIYLPGFVKKLKEYAKKYPSIRADFESLIVQLKNNPSLGISLGKDCYKIRLAIKSKGRGKSGGARVITCVKIQDGCLYFMSIYDKAEKDAISDADLKMLIGYIQQDLI